MSVRIGHALGFGRGRRHAGGVDAGRRLRSGPAGYASPGGAQRAVKAVAR
ncbi:hypothetical protein ABK046_20080 [Streptomyces caeruleatus]